MMGWKEKKKTDKDDDGGDGWTGLMAWMERLRMRSLTRAFAQSQNPRAPLSPIR
jgi:hypothetical protein